MHWNYRIIKRKLSDSEFDYGIYEVYYNENGEIEGHTEQAVTPLVDSPEGLKEELEIMLKAFEKEIIKYSDESSN